MSDYEASVREFMTKNLQHIGTNPFGPVPNEVVILRMRLMAEELGEVIAAMHEKNTIQIADGLADLLYVVVGTAIAYGIPINEVFDEVHASNMTKPRLDKHNKGGKVQKGGFRPPQIERILSKVWENTPDAPLFP
jgi:NTP pyrophosphatase (non-canonical NTP hydrolase)